MFYLFKQTLKKINNNKKKIIQHDNDNDDVSLFDAIRTTQSQLNTMK